MGNSTKIRLTEREDNVVVFTVEPNPLIGWYGKYETVISIDGELWKIAKGYDTLEKAIEGHIRFSEMNKEELIEYKYID